MSEVLETLERIESTFAYNKKGKKNVYSIFMDEFKVIEEYYKDYNKIKQALEHLEKLEKENQELKEDFLKPIGFMCGTRRGATLQKQSLIYLANKYNLPITIIDCETNNKCRKLEQALDIIKTKRVDIPMFYEIIGTVHRIFARDRYNQETNGEILTQEDFDSLIEVLGYEKTMQN